jgi:UDP-N-acetylmuramate: L-alanyl-gamma-D-glutamyl-meso-diaminopimelate ligase
MSAPEMRPGDVVAILSNGGFGGIYEKLPQRLRLMATNAAVASQNKTSTVIPSEA